MNLLLSLNQKFFEINPNEIISMINKLDDKKIIKGMEMCITDFSLFEKNYILRLSNLCKQNNYYLQIHGNSIFDIEKQQKIMDFINEISTIMNYKINVVLHPIEEDDKNNSNSNIYFSSILNYIYENNYNINISIENLNSTTHHLRLSKELILTILYNNEDLHFTYDIGHEIVEYGKITDLDEVLIKRMNNIHIHTFKNTFDHLPIEENDENKLKWLKGLEYLKYLKYNGNIVLEYDIYEVKGNGINEKVQNYIRSAYFISQYI
ncbi:MAG: hypothetical protein PHN42_02295 [Bacilli bacterium]|nr:hypothetical protein [Bacilli bacterium]